MKKTTKKKVVLLAIIGKNTAWRNIYGDLKGQPLLLPHRLNAQRKLANWFGEDFEKLNVLITSNLPSSSSVMSHHKMAYSLAICRRKV